MRRPILLAFLLAGLASADDVSAASDLCGQTLTTSTTFTADETCVGPGLIVGVNGITIDLAGFTLSGTSKASTGVDLGNHSGVTVKNGTIRGFDRGIRDGFRPTKLSHLVIRDNGQEGGILTDAAVDKCSFLTNGSAGLILNSGKVTSSGFVGNGFEGLFLQHATNVTATNVIAAQNHGAGIRVQFGSKIRISSATSAGNALAGVELDTGTATLKHSTIVGNLLDGVHLDDAGVDTQESLGIPAVIDGNLIAGNGGDGVHVTNASNGGVITKNRLRGNGGDGVRVDAACLNTLVQGNVAIGNDDVGFEVAEPTTALAKNIADANGAGIFTAAAIDGGGNAARANAGTQCSNAITCPPAFTPKPGSTTPTCDMVVATSIKLDSEPPFCVGTSGIVVDADDITIDLNGHRFHGDRTGGTIGVDVDFHRNVTIKNGILQGFGVGIHAGANSAGLKVVNVEVRDSVAAGVAVVGGGTAISKTVVVQNSGPGLVLSDTATAAKVSSSFFVGNTGDGLSSSGAGGVLSNVTSAGNTGAGMHLTGAGSGTVKGGIVAANEMNGILIDGTYGVLASGTVKGTFVVGNGEDGVVLDAGSVAMTFDSNFIGGSMEGIFLTNSPQSTLVKKNVLIGNHGGGLFVNANPLSTSVVQNTAIGCSQGFENFPLTSTFAKNTAAGNLMQGLGGVAGTDGGGNKAHDNGAEPQCAQSFVCN